MGCGQGSHMPQEATRDSHAMMGWWFASDKWRSWERNLLYFKFIHQEFHTVTCHMQGEANIQLYQQI